MEFFDVGIGHRGEVERHDLGEDEAADDDYPEGLAAFGGGASDGKGDRDGAHHGGKGGHEDGAASDHGCMGDGLVDRFVLVETGIICEVDEDDPVFHHDAKQHDHSNDGIKG